MKPGPWIPPLVYALATTCEIAAARPAVAQSPDDVLGPIVIRSSRIESTADRLPGAASILGEGDIGGGRQQLGLDESLAAVPGVFALNRYNFAQDLRIAIRGFGARSNFGIRGIRVFVDDVPATLPDGQSGVDAIDLGATDRIEVLRGPSASLYGTSAGGVLSLYTREGGGLPEAGAGATAGSHGYLETRAWASGGAGGPLDYSLHLARTTYDGFRDHAATERALLTTKFGYEFGAGAKLSLLLSAVDSPIADDPGGLTAAEMAADRKQASPLNLRFDAGESVAQQKIGAVLVHPVGAGGRLRLRGYAVQRDFDNKLPFSAVELNRFFTGGGIEYRHDGSVFDRANRLLLGADLDYQDDDRVRRTNVGGSVGAATFDQRERVLSAGPFARNELDLTPDLRFVLGLRYDSVSFDVDDGFLSDGDDSGSIDFNELSPSAGLSYRVAPGTHVYANASYAFETPTTTEFANPSGAGGFNQGLESQTARNLEIGIKGGARRKISYELALFHIAIDDQLVPFEIPASPGRFAFVNAGESTHQGVEAATRVSLTPGWSAGAAYTWSDFRFDRFRDQSGATLDGNRIPGIPEHLVNLDTRYAWPSGAFVAANARLTGGFFADNANTVEVPGHAVFDLRAGYERTMGPWRPRWNQQRPGSRLQRQRAPQRCRRALLRAGAGEELLCRSFAHVRVLIFEPERPNAAEEAQSAGHSGVGLSRILFRRRRNRIA